MANVHVYYCNRLYVISMEMKHEIFSDMSSRSGSRVRRLRTVDGVPNHSSEDSVAGHPSQTPLPITQGASSAASASSSVAGIFLHSVALQFIFTLVS